MLQQSFGVSSMNEQNQSTPSHLINQLSNEQIQGQINQSDQVLINNQEYRQASKKKSSSRLSMRTLSQQRSQLNLIKVCRISKFNDSGHKKTGLSQEQIIKKQCRICLQDQSQGRIIKPCKCTGSMQYVHEACLCQWIKRKFTFKSKDKVQCQVCFQTFQYKITKRLYLSYDHFFNNCQKNVSTFRCFFLILTLLILVWLALVVMAAIGINQDDTGWVRKYLMQTDYSRIIIFCVIFVFLVIICFVILLFIAEYGMKSEIFVKNVLDFTKKHKKIVPKMYRIAT